MNPTTVIIGTDNVDYVWEVQFRSHTIPRWRLVQTGPWPLYEVLRKFMSSAIKTGALPPNSEIVYIEETTPERTWFVLTSSPDSHGGKIDVPFWLIRTVRKPRWETQP